MGFSLDVPVYREPVTGTCHLCGLRAKLCDSHVIPNFLYEQACHNGSFVSLTNHPRHPARHLQTGFFEKLLCVTCEGQFSRYETPVAALLRRVLATPPPGVELTVFNDRLSPQLFDYDYHELKLFGLSVIWRCHIATRHSFVKVNLGPHGKRIRTMLLREDPGATADYPFLLTRIVGSEVASRTLFPPTPRRLEVRGCPSVRAYMMRAMGFDWWFVVSSHTREQFAQHPFVGAGPQLMIGVNHLDDTTELLKIRDTAVKWGKL